MSFKIDKTRIKPYGDTLNDGRMQLSFSMLVACDRVVLLLLRLFEAIKYNGVN